MHSWSRELGSFEDDLGIVVRKAAVDEGDIRQDHLADQRLETNVVVDLHDVTHLHTQRWVCERVVHGGDW